jgi:sialic acid synthase SpsE
MKFGRCEGNQNTCPRRAGYHRFCLCNGLRLTILKKGELFTKENIWVKRPGTGGVLAEYFNDIIGKTVER